MGGGFIHKIVDIRYMSENNLLQIKSTKKSPISVFCVCFFFVVILDALPFSLISPLGHTCNLSSCVPIAKI